MKHYSLGRPYTEAMSEEMRKTSSIYLMGEEVAEYNELIRLLRVFTGSFWTGKEIIDTPISELGFFSVIGGFCYELAIDGHLEFNWL